MSRVFEVLLEPVGFLWLALLIGACVLAGRKRPLVAFFLFLLALVLWLFGASPLPAHLLAAIERPYDRRPQTVVTNADAVVMLGGTHSFTSRGMFGIEWGETSDRMVTALELMRQGHAPALVLGGAKYRLNGEDRPDSELIEDWIRSWKLPAGRVLLLGICVSTRDEAVRVAQLAAREKWKRVILVSSGYHLRRAEATFRKLGIEVIPVGCDFVGLDGSEAEHPWSLVPHLEGLRILRLYLHEQIGWLYYSWKGWV
jgi:uncharacterized SAM-binding protein YcdF (DUF218 family)